MDAVLSIFYFIIAIGILVTVHEWGHFIFARLFKMRVDKFYVGFDFGGVKLYSIKRGETEYGIGAFPLGGYVKIAGMIDESMDTDYASKPPEPWEFRSKPVWQRVIVLSGGVFMNFVFAALIFAVLNITNGSEKIKNLPLYIPKNTTIEKLGFETGDKILQINNEKIVFWDDVFKPEFLAASKINFEVEHQGGKKEIIEVSQGVLMDEFQKQNFPQSLISPQIENVLPNSSAAKIGITSGSLITKINGDTITNWSSMVEKVQSLKNQSFAIEWKEGKIEQTVVQIQQSGVTKTALVQGDENGKLGIMVKNSIERENIPVGIFQGLQNGFIRATNALVLTAVGIKNIITGELEFSKAVGGPVKIAKMAGKTAEEGIGNFFVFMAILSISLAFMNILPLPALDGGQIVVNLIEGIMRRELPIKVKIGIQQAGFALFIVLTLFVLYNDIMN